MNNAGYEATKFRFVLPLKKRKIFTQKKDYYSIIITKIIRCTSCSLLCKKRKILAAK